MAIVVEQSFIPSAGRDFPRPHSAAHGFGRFLMAARRLAADAQAGRATDDAALDVLFDRTPAERGDAL